MKPKNQKVDEGQERNAEWRLLSPAHQLASLDRRLGKGVGALRQRTMLAYKLAPEPEPAVTAAEPVKPKKAKKK